MHKPELKPGTPLSIVFANELNMPNAHYLKAVIYDCHLNVITMSQTSPGLTKRFLNRRIFITFLVSGENRVMRFGFPAQLIDIITNYELSEGKMVEALVAVKSGDPEPTDFRMFFRVKPPSDADLCIFMDELKVSLFDISIGGAQFIYPKRNIFRQGQSIEFKILIGTNSFDVEATVRNVRDPEPGAANKNLQYVSVQFRHNSKEMETALSRAILDIERNLLSQGKMV